MWIFCFGAACKKTKSKLTSQNLSTATLQSPKIHIVFRKIFQVNTRISLEFHIVFWEILSTATPLQSPELHIEEFGNPFPLQH
jgi:hypothetical protein